MVLLECRRREMVFSQAWDHAMQVLKIERHNMDETTKTEIREWRKALAWGKEHFEAAYCSRADDTRAARPPSLSDALAASESAGDRVRDTTQRNARSSRQNASQSVTA